MSFFTKSLDLIERLFERSLTDIVSGIWIRLEINSVGFSKACSEILAVCLTKNSSPSSSFCSFFVNEGLSFFSCFLTPVVVLDTGSFFFSKGACPDFLTFLLTRVLLSACLFLLSSSDFLKASPSILFFSTSEKSIFPGSKTFCS